MKSEYESLKEQITYHSHRYYVLDNPQITDEEYDIMMRRLLEIEVLHDAHYRRIVHMAAHLAADMVLREHVDESLIGDKNTCLALVVRLSEIPSINNLKVEEAHKVISYR